MNKILLIIQREYLTRVRKRSFLLTTFLIPLLFIGMYATIFYVALHNDEPVTTVYVVDESGQIANRLTNTDHLAFVQSTQSAEQQKKNLEKEKEENHAVLLLIPANIHETQTVELYDTEKKGIQTLRTIEAKLNDILKVDALKAAGIDLQTLTNLQTDVTIKSKQLTVEGEKDSSVGAAIGVSFGLSILIYLSLFLYGNQVMRGVIEEKSNRVIEVVISSVKPFQLMLGKIIGIGLVGVTQFILWIFLSVSFMGAISAVMLGSNEGLAITTSPATNTEQSIHPTNTEENSKIQSVLESIKTIDYGPILGCFLLYFIGGYLLYSALFAMVGSAVDSETETQQFMLPIIMPLLFTYMLSFSVLVNNPHGSLAFWLSIIPFTSPIGMLVRIPFGVPMWQLVLSITLLIIGFIGTTYIAARIYRVGILMYGKKASYRELIKWFKYKG